MNERLKATLETVKKGRISLSETERLTGCECVETMKTYAVLWGSYHDPEAIAIHVPKTALLDENGNPLPSIGFRKCGDFATTVNLPIPADSLVLMGKYIPPAAMDTDVAPLLRKPRFGVTLPSKATHFLVKYGEADNQHGTAGYNGFQPNEVMQSALRDPQLVQFMFGNQRYLICPLGYVNMVCDPSVDEEKTDAAVLQERIAIVRRNQYVTLMEEQIADELQALLEKCNKVKQEEYQQKLEQLNSDLMKRVETALTVVNEIVRDEPEMNACKFNLQMPKIQLQPPQVELGGRSYTLNDEGVEHLEEAAATLRRQLQRYREARRVMTLYLAEARKYRFPLYYRDEIYNIVQSTQPVLPGMKPHPARRRYLVMIFTEDSMTLHEMRNSEDLGQIGGMFRYERREDLIMFDNLLTRLMNDWRYQHLKKRAS